MSDFNYCVPSFNGKESERDIMITGFEEAVKKFYYEQWGIKWTPSLTTI